MMSPAGLRALMIAMLAGLAVWIIVIAVITAAIGALT